MKTVLFNFLCLLGIFGLSASLTGCAGGGPSQTEIGYEFIDSWGRKGSGSGEFNDPTGIAVSQDQVFVSDGRNSRIQVFDFEGNFKRQLRLPGDSGNNQARPMNLAVHESELYVADYFNDEILIYSLAGKLLRSVGRPGTGPGEFNSPGGVAVSSAGDMFVADFYNHRIQKLRPDGSFIRQWGETARSGVGSGSFSYPTDVALGPDGRLFVADGYNDRVQVFGEDGAFETKWGGLFAMNVPGPFKGWFKTVTAVEVDASGRVFAVDFYNHRVQVFSRDGAFLTSFGKKGKGPGEFTFPMAIAVAGNGTVFVTDHGNSRIQVWRPKRPPSSAGTP